MLANKLRYLLIGLLLFISGCSRSGTNPISTGLADFGRTVYTTFMSPSGTPYVTISLMFIAMVIGTFAMFKGLLRFAFKKDFSDSTFGPKEINVIALMLSIIGTTGIFYVFRNDPPTMITYIGGSVGLLFVLFICVLIMRFFIDAAKSFEDSEGALGKGPAWIFIFTLGTIFSLFLLLGYAGQILKSLGCKLQGEAKDAVCNGGVGDYNLFFVIYNNGSTIIGWLFLIAVLFGIFWLVKANKKDDEPQAVSSSDSSGDGGWFGKVFSGGKPKQKNELSKEVAANVKNMQGNVKEFHKGLGEIKKSINKQNEILTEVSKELRRGGGLE